MKSEILIVITILSLGFTSNAIKHLPNPVKNKLKVSLPTSPELKKEWENFKKKFRKVYGVASEESDKYSAYVFNKQFVDSHNSGKHTYTITMNEFGDRSFSQSSTGGCTVNSNVIKKSTVVKKQSNLRIKCPVIDKSAADSCDWRLVRDAVSPVKDQGNCGSCWAFSVINIVEGWNVLTSGKKPDLSVQHLVNCVPYHCKHGNVRTALEWISKNDIAPATQYPYTENKGECPDTSRQNLNKHQFTIEEVGTDDEEELKQVIENYGPISASIVTKLNTFRLYSSGIYSDIQCSGKPDHAVTIVGYGHDASVNKDYWIVKNSWGDDWGEKGYIKIERGKNVCCIACDGVYIRSVSSRQNNPYKDLRGVFSEKGILPKNSGQHLKFAVNIHQFMLLLYIIFIH